MVTTNENRIPVIDELNPFSPTLFLIAAKMSLAKRSVPYWSNPPFQFFDIQALWHSVLSIRVPKCQKIKRVG